MLLGWSFLSLLHHSQFQARILTAGLSNLLWA
jgi:hypothetical protein